MLYGISFNGLAIIIFYSGLLIIFFTDLKYYLILDKITIPLSIVGLVFTFFNFNPFDVDILSSFLGGAVGYLVIYIIRFLFFKIRKVEGMGLGDAKLFLMIGIWLGIKSIYLILASSALVGAIVGSLIIYFYKKDKDFQIPYGCFIVIASALYPYLGSLFYNLI
jgi:leader peptidase (prepilin peptidase)/N-methyltransferase